MVHRRSSVDSLSGGYSRRRRSSSCLSLTSRSASMERLQASNVFDSNIPPQFVLPLLDQIVQAGDRCTLSLQGSLQNAIFWHIRNMLSGKLPELVFVITARQATCIFLKIVIITFQWPVSLSPRYNGSTMTPSSPLMAGTRSSRSAVSIVSHSPAPRLRTTEPGGA